MSMWSQEKYYKKANYNYVKIMWVSRLGIKYMISSAQSDGNQNGLKWNKELLPSVKYSNQSTYSGAWISHTCLYFQ